MGNGHDCIRSVFLAFPADGSRCAPRDDVVHEILAAVFPSNIRNLRSDIDFWKLHAQARRLDSAIDNSLRAFESECLFFKQDPKTTLPLTYDAHKGAWTSFLTQILFSTQYSTAPSLLPVLVCESIYRIAIILVETGLLGGASSNHDLHQPASLCPEFHICTRTPTRNFGSPCFSRRNCLHLGQREFAMLKGPQIRDAYRDEFKKRELCWHGIQE